MPFCNIEKKYYSPAGEEDKGGAGAAPEITPEVQVMIDARVSEQVTGLKNKNGELLGKLKEQTESLKRFEGIDPDAVRSVLQQFENDEEAKLIASGKMKEVIEKRTERLRSDSDKQVKAAMQRAEQAESFADKFRDRVLGDSVRSVAIKTQAVAGADEDILRRAKDVFKINDEGEAVAVDREGNAILGKDGRTPLSLIEWVESLKDVAPHLWPQASGTGAVGGGKSTANLKRSEMTAQQKADYIRSHGQSEFLKLPK